MELAVIIIMVALYAMYKCSINRQIDNYPHEKIDTKKLNMDVARGVSVAERRRRLVNGYYDK